MNGELIHVTRWDNANKTFVDVGMLCESNDLEKPFPLVAFNYTEGYLDKYKPLYPQKMLNNDASTLVSDAEYNAALPKAFAPYLPNNIMKSALSHLINDFDDMTPFQQLKAVTEIKGDFGAVQLNYNNETQHNSLPHTIGQASRLLDIMRNKEYAKLSLDDVNAIYNYDEHNPSVRMVHWDNTNAYKIATVSQAENDTRAKQSVVMQGVMAAAGIDVLDISIEKYGDKDFIVQVDPVEKISNQPAETLFEDSIHIHPLMRNTKYISDEANVCASEVGNLCRAIGGASAAKEVYARAVISQVMNQRDFNIKQVTFKEVGGKLKLSPQLVNPIVLEDDSPFQLPLVSGQSNLVAYNFKEIASPMLARTFGITERQQDKILGVINDAFSLVNSIAESKGISTHHAAAIQKIHESSGIFKVPIQHQGPVNVNTPDIDM